MALLTCLLLSAALLSALVPTLRNMPRRCRATRARKEGAVSMSWKAAAAEAPGTAREQTLLTMCRGDEKLCERLIRNAQQRNPHRGRGWAVEKVIWDLSRDRQA
jgi:hypothetical protein